MGFPKGFATLQMFILLFCSKLSFTQSTISSVLLINGYPEYSASSLWEMENHSKTCVLSIVCSPKAISHILKVTTAFSPTLKQSLCTQTILPSLQFFWVHQRHRRNKRHLYLTRHYPTITHATALFQADNDSADSTISTPSGTSW
jgi:hypothetical protein